MIFFYLIDFGLNFLFLEPFFFPLYKIIIYIFEKMWIGIQTEYKSSNFSIWFLVIENNSKFSEFHLQSYIYNINFTIYLYSVYIYICLHISY